VAIGDVSTQTFVETYYTRNATEWFIEPPVGITADPPNYVSMVSVVDDVLFDASQNQGQTLYGDYFFYQLQSDKSQYSVITLVNATSQDAVAAFAANVHETILRDIVDPGLNLTVILNPFPLTMLEQSVLVAAAGTSSSILFSIAFMMISNSLISNIIAERRRNVKNQMIISGVDLSAYWVAHYLVDLVFQAPPSICIIVGIKAFNLDVSPFF